MAEATGFARARPDELLGWAGPDAGPPAPAVCTNPSDDGVAALSPAVACAVAAGLLDPTAAESTWTLIGPNVAAGVVDGRRLLVVDETDPYGWFSSFGVYQLVGCRVCDEHAVPLRLAATAPEPGSGRGRRHAGRAGAPTRPGSPDAPPPPAQSRLPGEPSANPASRSEAHRRPARPVGRAPPCLTDTPDHLNARSTRS